MDLADGPLPMTVSLPPQVVREFQEVGRLLWEAGLVSSHGGNMSVRLPEGLIVVTRHGAMLGRLEAQDLMILGAEGEPSWDTPIHQAIYSVTQAGAVLHAHPVHAVALSYGRRELRPQDLEGRHHLGEMVPVVPKGDHVPQALAVHPVAIWEGHGCYARGDDLWQALKYASVLEESARILWLRQAFP